MDKMLLTGQEIGILGEYLAERYLKKKGYSTVEKNYTRKRCGEIDIISTKDGKICFFEVKTLLKREGKTIDYLPEERITKKKIKTIDRMVQIYILEKKLEDVDIVTGVISVIIEPSLDKAKVEIVDIVG